ncbi:class I SAM-dependent methyltransferase [Kribbella sp. CA-294648]|uniref:class I SAM-dependent methyltransferase n=1 Tax=Kribbella sp. CA-294648 TaxID=3239948 RepID=UPI003D8B0A11
MQFVAAQGIRDATVLEIGGGVGEIQLELLRLGAGRVTNLEITSNYEAEAERLIAQAGAGGRITRRQLDIARSSDQVEAADVVILHRVVCCYPDYQRLLSAAGSHARRMLVFSHPGDNLPAKAAIWFENVLRRVRGNSFRAYAHSAAAMVAAAEAQGLAAEYKQRSGAWHVVGLVRRSQEEVESTER